MNTNKIHTVYFRIDGRNSTFAIKRMINPLHYQYNVYQLLYEIEIIKKLIEILDNEFENFLENFLQIDEKYFSKNSRRTRHYIAKNIEDLYLNQDMEFTKQFYYPYKDYYIVTNIGSKEIKKYLHEMCEACDINLEPLSNIKF